MRKKEEEKQIVKVLPYDGKTARRQRRYIRFLENAFVVSLLFLVISIAVMMAQAALLLT